MNIVFKNSFKNIFCKPFRTLLVVFAIFVCSLCALLCFDLSESITTVLTGYMGNISRADFIVIATGSDVSTLPDGFPEADTMTIVGDSEMLYKKIDGEYCYVTTDSLRIFGLNVDEAVDMNFIAPIDIKDDEIYLTTKFAEDFGYKVGDKIIIHDRALEELELTVGGLLPSDTNNPLIVAHSGVVNLNTSSKISCGKLSADMLMIDLKDNSKIEEAKKMLEARYPDASIQDLYLTDSDMQMINELKAVFYLLFAITFLLVIFVTASICNRIVSERMSFIGTLRSLGMSTARTGRILLLENVLYALLGSIPATALYSVIRNPILDFLFRAEDGSGNVIKLDMPPYPFALVIGVILGAVLIECLIPLKAILKALKTSIRDIIFDNRDTEYKYSKTTLVMGIIFLALAVVTFFFRTNIILATVCMLSTVAALAMLFPRILKLVASLVKNIADKTDKPTWSLAAVEATSRKSTVGSGVLCTTAAAMCIIVYALSGAMSGNMNSVPYECDVVFEPTKETKYYSYIEHLENVTDVETVYEQIQVIKLNDAPVTYAYFFALPENGYKYFTGFESAPEKLEEGTVAVDSRYAKRKGIKEGDTIKVTLNPEGVVPVERTYTVAEIFKINTDSISDVILVNMDEYQLLVRDMPGRILIKSTDPEGTKKLLETYAKGTYNSVKTFDEVIEDQKSSNAKAVAIIGAIIAIALGMTAIGMISNQLLGFEGRKKECAVMLSTAMGKGKLSGILLKEVLITSFTASGIGTIVGTVLTTVLSTALASAQTVAMEVDIDPVHIILFFIAMTVVFTGTVLFPIRNLRKMKISEQIKYE